MRVLSLLHSFRALFWHLVQQEAQLRTCRMRVAHRCRFARSWSHLQRNTQSPHRHTLNHRQPHPTLATTSIQGVCDELALSGLAHVVRVSLGPVPLLASHCIVMLHHYLDRLAHTCDVERVARTPAELRGQQCQSSEAYSGWGDVVRQ